MQIIWYILLAILGISALVITHELGHYLTGKWLGFTIVEFSVGLGPKLFGIKGKETEFTLRALPIGGSCRFYGEDQEVQDDRCFNAKPAWKRFLVVLGGPLTNILTCVVLSFVILLAFGSWEYGDKSFVLVTEVNPDGPAYVAGVEEGDILLSIDGQTFDDYETFKSLMNHAKQYGGMELGVLRGAKIATATEEHNGTTTTTIEPIGGTELTLNFSSLNVDQATGDKRIAVSVSWQPFSYMETHYNVLTAAAGAFPYTWDLGKLIYESFMILIQGKASFRDMAGVVGVVDVLSETMAQAETTTDAAYIFLRLMALIAVNLGIVNLFPLPALDGGRLIFIILEMIRKKPVPPEKEGMVHLIGMVLLLGLMVALTVSDLLRCFGG